MIAKKLTLITALFFSILTTAFAGNVNVVGTLTYTQGQGGVYNYTLVMTNSGPEGVYALWLGWIVGQFNIQNAGNPGNNLGWNNAVDGASLQYAGTVNTAIPAGGRGVFTFTSTSTPTDFANQSAGPSVAYGTNTQQFAIENTTQHSEEFSPTVDSNSPPPAPPVITSQPLGTNAITNDTVIFSVTASNAISYQWQSNTVNISGETNTTLTLNNVVLADAATYRVVVSNDFFTVTSSNAVLTVSAGPPPGIVTQPQSTNAVTNDTVTFTVVATNALYYQWQSNMVDLSGATNDTLVLSNVTIDDSATYRVLVSNDSSGVISSNAVLIVSAGPLPAILTQPVGTNVLVNSTVVFSVVASNVTSYQWESNTVAIPGETNDTLTLTNVTVNDSATYRVIVANDNGSLPSSDAALLVGFPAAITTQPTNVEVLSGTTVTLHVGATGIPAPQFQWRSNDVALPGATSSALALGTVHTNSGGIFSVTVSNIFGGQVSSNAILTVDPFAPGTKAKLTVVINPIKAGSVNPNLNGKTLVVGTNYTVTATGAKGQVFSHWSGIAGTDDRVLTFAMPGISNATLTANFVPSPFASNNVAGTYAGLFWDTNHLSGDASGFVTTTMAASGTLSGQVKIGGASTSFTTVLRADGSGTVQIKRKNLSTLILDLQVDLAGSGILTGTVTDSSNAFDAPLTAYRAAFSNTHKATTYAGYYTWEMPGVSSNGPGGFSFGTATIAPAGTAKITLGLSDGTAGSASAGISAEGYVPVYASLYSGKGSFLAWLWFTNSSTAFSTNSAFWFKKPITKATYPAGFSLTNLTATLGLYTAPPKGQNAFNASGTGVSLSGSDLASPFGIFIPLNANGAGSTTTNHLSVSVAGKTGLITGSFKDPASGKTVKLSGVVIDQFTDGFGYFLGNNLSGELQIGPP